MIQAEHRYQRVELEDCYIEATRDDTAEIQDCHYAVWKNGRKIVEGWVTYNIQYDYCRIRKWWHGKLCYDYLDSDETYGHLAYEYWLMPSPDGRYPGNWEPVTPQGSDYFRHHGVSGGSTMVLECNVSFSISFFRRDTLTECPIVDVIDCVEPLTPDDIERVKYAIESHEEHTFEELKEKRINCLREFSTYIGVEIPYDPRFID